MIPRVVGLYEAKGEGNLKLWKPCDFNYFGLSVKMKDGAFVWQKAETAFVIYREHVSFLCEAQLNFRTKKAASAESENQGRRDTL